MSKCETIQKRTHSNTGNVDKSDNILLTVTVLWSKLLLRNLVQKLWK